MKKIKIIVLLFYTICLQAQDNTLSLRINNSEYLKFCEKNFQERYKYTFDKYDSIKDLEHKYDFGINYDLKSFYLKPIPVFKLKLDAVVSKKQNIIDFFDFTNVYTKQFYNVYRNNDFFGTLKFRKEEKYDLVDFSLLFNKNNKEPIISESLFWENMRTSKKEEFIFLLENFADVYFIISENKIFAVYHSFITHKLEKMEINQFMATKVNKTQFNNVLNNKPIRIKPQILRKRYYKQDYFVNLILE